MNPIAINDDKFSAFHIAAKSANPNLIIWMLDAFAPSKYGWDIDDADDVNPDSPTLLDICVEKGNSQAVAALIQHGADISKGVLHKLVDESARNPDKAQSYLDIYQAIVDNAVVWRCLEKNDKFPLKGSTKYYECLRTIMRQLISLPKLGDDNGPNVIEHAIEAGSYEILIAIMNTDHVYREHRADMCNSLRCTRAYANHESHYRFDVTGFVWRETCCRCLDEDKNDQPEQKTSNKNAETDSQQGILDQPTEMADNHPKLPYLCRLIKRKDQWMDTDILNAQPFREMTNPFISFIQRIYFAIGVAQLIYMVFFSAAYIPTSCSLSDQFNLSLNACYTENRTQQFTLSQATGYVIWPAILGFFILCDLVARLVREVPASMPDSFACFFQVAKI